MKSDFSAHLLILKQIVLILYFVLFKADLLDCSGSSEDVFETSSKKQGAIVGKLERF